MFAYCLNNPIVHSDSSGSIAIEVIVSAGLVVCILVCGVVLAKHLAMSIASFFDYISTQWYCQIAQIEFIASTQSKESSETASSQELVVPGAPEPPNNKKPSLKKLTKYLIKKLGIDPHKVKYEYLGKKADISRYDLAYDTITGTVYIITKNGQIIAETYYNVFS